MARRRAIIIGGGVAGLSTGCYLQMNGYDSEILEMGSSVGGVAVSWKRKGFTFDGATSWLPGSSPALNFHPILREVLDMDEMEFVDLDVFLEIDVDGGTPFRVRTDVRALREEMLAVAPEDRGVIEEFASAVAEVSRLRIPVEKAPELYGPVDLARNLRSMLAVQRFILRWRRWSIEQYAGRFRNPRMRRLFQLIFHRHEHFSVMSLILALGWMNTGSAGHPVGGSERFVGMIESRYGALGGRIALGCRVEEILVRRGTAYGVRLRGGETREADIIISACDLHSTIHGMLGNRYRPRGLLGDFETLEIYPANVQVSMGIARTFEGEPHRLLLPLVRSLRAGGDEMKHMLVILSNLDPSFAPPGSSSIVVQIRTREHTYWQSLRQGDRAAYRAEKTRFADTVMESLERRFGSLAPRPGIVDVATPATYERFTNVWKGSYQGWAPTPRVIGRRMSKRLAGLDRFYLAGQWVDVPGGLPRVIMSGRNVVQLICRDDGREFRTA